MTKPFLFCGSLALALAAYSCSGDDSITEPDGSGGAADGGAGADSGGTRASAGDGSGGTDHGVAGQSGPGGSGGDGSAGDGPQAGSGGQRDGGGGEPSSGGDSGAAGSAGAGAGSGTCEVGEVQSSGTQQNLDLFGTVVYFDDGAELPAGRYRIDYVDGCMKYGSGQGWTIHAYAHGENYAWWFVGATTADKIVMPPATVGVFVGDGQDGGAFATFEECVAANLAVEPKEFDFLGGKLGVWLQDSPYSDNLAGDDGRNPKWKLTLLAPCEESTP